MLVVQVRPAVERNDPCVVDHFVADRHRLGVLDDAHAVAVDDRQRRAEHAARDAAIVEREVLERVERAGTERAAIAVRRTGAPGRRHLRNSAVGGIDDERRITERADTPLVAQERFTIRGEVFAAFVAARALLELLGRQRRPRAEILGPLRRHAAHVVRAPDAFEARVAPRGSGRFPIAIASRGCRRLRGHCAHRRRRGGGAAAALSARRSSECKGDAGSERAKNRCCDTNHGGP